MHDAVTAEVCRRPSARGPFTTAHQDKIVAQIFHASRDQCISDAHNLSFVAKVQKPAQVVRAPSRPLQ